MLSICIPVYNYDIRPLARSLHAQGEKLKIPFEIIIADDASENIYRAINKEPDNLKHFTYIQLNENIGRSMIRNHLAEKASYPYLLFMDWDSLPPDDLYLERYMSYCKDSIIVCGGRCHSPAPGDKSLKLRWYYGINREEKTATQRNLKPNSSFMTNNFLISKDLFKEFYLNEAISGYGHEDTYFGYQLKKNKIPVIHIDNPLIHVGLEPSHHYLEKTKKAISNLLNIYKISGYDKDIVEMISLLKAFCRIKRYKITFLMRFIYTIFRRSMEKNLLGSKPKLWIFDLYKLGYICKISKKHHN